MRSACFALLGLIVGYSGASAQDPVQDILKALVRSLGQGKADEALNLAAKAAELAPKNHLPPYFRGQAYEMKGQFDKAITSYSQAAELSPKFPNAYQARGSAHFKAGHIQESLKDFDHFLELQPQQKAAHWQRGITLYYAGKYAEGKDQFALADKISYDDVENVFWHYLCNARATNLENARKEMLPMGKDSRIPLMEVHALISGKAKPEDILKAAMADDPPKEKLKVQLFYAHLYLGLYYEAQGDSKKAFEHLEKAASEEFRIPHYMGDVARVHRDLLKKK